MCSKQQAECWKLEIPSPFKRHTPHKVLYIPYASIPWVTLHKHFSFDTDIIDLGEAWRGEACCVWAAKQSMTSHQLLCKRTKQINILKDWKQPNNISSPETCGCTILSEFKVIWGEKHCHGYLLGCINEGNVERCGLKHFSSAFVVYYVICHQFTLTILWWLKITPCQPGR